MGIHGLLPQLKSIMVPIHISELSGQTVAIDTYSWLHKGAFSCSTQLCKEIPTSKHIQYCMHRVNLLRHHDVKPILVFDGGSLPMKMDQETKRSRARKENLERAMKHEAAGNSAAAFECYQKALDISPSIALGLIQVLKREKVDYIVAPYEADAQMTFLLFHKHVDAVITEDSDLIPFGCSRIIFKMDKFGQAVQFQSSLLGQNKELDFTGFTKEMLLEMCIFSGCDYLQSLPGMGLKRAHALVQKLKNYGKVIKHLRYSGITVPPLYEENFKKAIWSFQHQRVYDPAKEEIVHLSYIADDNDEDLDYLGPWLPPSVAKGIAIGDLDPFTKLPFEVKATCVEAKFENTYSKEFTNGRKRLDLPVQKNNLTNYFCLASLEAKRKFRAPKVMPKSMVIIESSPSPDSLGSVSSGSAEEATPLVNHHEGSLLPRHLGSNPSSKIEGTLSDESNNPKESCLHVAENIASSQPSCLETKCESLHRSLTSQKDHGCISAFDASAHEISVVDAAESNKKSSTSRIVTKSSYFFRNSYSENDYDDQNQEHFVSGDDKSLLGNSRSRVPKVASMKQRTSSMELPLNENIISSPQPSHLESEHELRHTSFVSQKEHGCISALNETEHGSSEVDAAISNRKASTRKAVTKSSYFFHNSFCENDHDNQKQEHFVNEEDKDCHGDSQVPKVASVRHSYPKSAPKKRKLSLHKETLQAKTVNTSPIEEGDPVTNLNNNCIEGRMEGNFGCNVSHLENYSGIAEKSMERFVSLISSFKYNSSGARASGLRPPIKDVQNTSLVRSTHKSKNAKTV